MALVSYTVSDESGSEEDESPSISNKTVATFQNTTTNNIASSEEFPKNVVDSEDNVELEENALFSVLPTPKTKPLVLDSGFSKRLLLNKPSQEKSTKKSVKISIPALSEFDEELPRPITKKIVPSGKGSKLFDILPPPKYSSGVVPPKLVPDKLKKEIPKKFLKQPEKPVVKPIVAAPEVDEDSGDESPGDFFCLNRPAEPEPVYELPQPVIAPEIVPEEAEIPQEEHFVEETSSYPTGDFVAFNQDNLTLDDEAIQKLCGGGKRKRTALNAEIIDVSEKDVRPDKDEWLMKALTEQKRTRSHKKSTGPSSQQKRKHQITYLAYQAKEQEEELQNQWASNRMTKKQTQSKYGF